jgi:hypothetical protein
MSKTGEFWQYAKEAILSASRAKTDDERQGLLDLAGTWTQAALAERQLLADYDNPIIAALKAALNRPGWLNLLGAECPSISAAARLAAWQCSPLAKMKVKSSNPLLGSAGTAPSRKNKTRNSRPA